jgi:hypothetical protein
VNRPVDVLAVMNRHDMADALHGMPGFNRDAFYIADAARSFMRIAESFSESWGPLNDGAVCAKAEASRRYAALRHIRRPAARVGGAA